MAPFSNSFGSIGAYLAGGCMVCNEPMISFIILGSCSYYPLRAEVTCYGSLWLLSKILPYGTSDLQQVCPIWIIYIIWLKARNNRRISSGSFKKKSKACNTGQKSIWWISQRLYVYNMQLDRLATQKFQNPYDVFLLNAEATDEDIRRQFRNVKMWKIDFEIHPSR